MLISHKLLPQVLTENLFIPSTINHQNDSPVRAPSRNPAKHNRSFADRLTVLTETPILRNVT